MVIDFHTHIFPDKIAYGAISKLESSADIKAHTNGTLTGLMASMEEGNIDYSVILPVVTAARQFDSINRFADQIKEMDHIISFGGIHPDTEDYKMELKTIRDYGLMGVKIHPEYQTTYIDDIKYLRILDYASELGLIVSVHAGFDAAFPTERHCTPERIAGALKQVQPDKLVLAHMGGLDMWDEVEEYIVGRNVYLDTSFSIGRMDDEQFVRIVRSHGAGKVLFATDSPWGGQKEMLKHFDGMEFTLEEKEQILYKNAINLLGGKIR